VAAMDVASSRGTTFSLANAGSICFRYGAFGSREYVELDAYQYPESQPSARGLGMRTVLVLLTVDPSGTTNDRWTVWHDGCRRG
jgi:hypothetical protein